MKKSILITLVTLFALAEIEIATEAAPEKEKVTTLPVPVYLFSSFRGNGEDGLHLAYSRDGYTWTPLRGDASFLKGEVGKGLMRDPCIHRGPDGVFHMVWTTGWDDKGFGYADSKDLIQWSKQEYIPINEKNEKAENTWAPELFFDEEKSQWLIVWATTMTGLLPPPEDERGDHNHRQYFTVTKDFKSFGEPKLFYDPGFNCIDGTLIKEGGIYRLIFKDERIGQKRLRMATAEHPEGPYSAASEPFTRDWVEGPSAIRIGAEWFVYFDHYYPNMFYGAVKSRDFQTWEDVSDRISFPPDFRHGTAFEADEAILRPLLD
jgi:hypothetical protein